MSVSGKTCVSFGDSITTAYELGFNNSYAGMFAKENNFELANYARDGLTSGGLLNLLNEIEKDQIIQAEILTLYIGANDLLNLLSEEAKSLDLNSPNIDEMNAFGARLSSADFAVRVTEVLERFKVNYTQIIDCLKDYNKNIYALTVYNPYIGIVLENQIYGLNRISLGFICGGWLEKFNKIIKEVNQEKDVRTADVFSAFNNYLGSEKLTNAYADIFSLSFKLDPHPTLKGQQLIFEVLQEEFTKSYSEPFQWWIVLVILGLMLVSLAGLIVRKNKNVPKKSN